jgi:hypothetical protein
MQLASGAAPFLIRARLGGRDPYGSKPGPMPGFFSS